MRYRSGGTEKELSRHIQGKNQKMTRYIGISCYGNPKGLTKAQERYDFDCVQMALNAVMQGQIPNRYGSLKKNQGDIYSEALPPVPQPGKKTGTNWLAASESQYDGTNPLHTGESFPIQNSYKISYSQKIRDPKASH